MLTVLRKFFGFVVLAWVLLFGFGLICIGIGFLLTMGEGQHGALSRGSASSSWAQAAGAILALSLLTLWAAVPSAAIWIVLKIVQKQSQPKLVYVYEAQHLPQVQAQPAPPPRQPESEKRSREGLPTQLVVGFAIFLAGGIFLGGEYLIVKWYPYYKQHVAEKTLALIPYHNDALGIDMQVAEGIYRK